ncbi:MAG TPA: hypothetical protein VKB46_07970 [Pyrinomonadaceae bacterium]|nr:hypothetical protein [Pyrinomonadaceae bacterium]
MKHKSYFLAVLFLLTMSGFALATPPDQPHMEAARDSLQKAKAELQVAEHNKGGHRAKAVGLVNNAIAEVNRGIQFAKKHNHAKLFAATPDQPHMEAALGFLQNAKVELDAATPDKGGHRGNALKLVQQAIDEVNLGIAAGR